MESRGDGENAERILYNMNPKQLVDVACQAFHQKSIQYCHELQEVISPKEVFLSIFLQHK